MVHKFAEYKKFNLAITPEGTRKANPNWKKGFYFIALKAQVPIVLIGIDYSKKTISATKAIMPSGDINKDMREIKLTSRISKENIRRISLLEKYDLSIRY